LPKFCSTSPARATGHNLHGTHRKRSGATGTDRTGVAQPDSIRIDFMAVPLARILVPELITAAVVSAVMPVMGR
jgi:hypothetical protein